MVRTDVRWRGEEGSTSGTMWGLILDFQAKREAMEDGHGCESRTRTRKLKY